MVKIVEKEFPDQNLVVEITTCINDDLKADVYLLDNGRTLQTTRLIVKDNMIVDYYSNLMVPDIVMETLEELGYINELTKNDVTSLDIIKIKAKTLRDQIQKMNDIREKLRINKEKLTETEYQFLKDVFDKKIEYKYRGIIPPLYPNAMKDFEEANGIKDSERYQFIKH